MKQIYAVELCSFISCFFRCCSVWFCESYRITSNQISPRVSSNWIEKQSMVLIGYSLYLLSNFFLQHSMIQFGYLIICCVFNPDIWSTVWILFSFLIPCGCVIFFRCVILFDWVFFCWAQSRFLVSSKNTIMVYIQCKCSNQYRYTTQKVLATDHYQSVNLIKSFIFALVKGTGHFLFFYRWMEHFLFRKSVNGTFSFFHCFLRPDSAVWIAKLEALKGYEYSSVSSSV